MVPVDNKEDIWNSSFVTLLVEIILLKKILNYQR